MVFVKDYHTGNMIFKSALLPRETARYTVPAGYLQGGTTYTWFVMLWDGAFSNGVYASNIFTTHPFSASPTLSWAYLITMPPTGAVPYYVHSVPFGLGFTDQIDSVRLKDASGGDIASGVYRCGLPSRQISMGTYFQLHRFRLRPASRQLHREVVQNRSATLS
jgi:hypothetical protein